ncbi:hypothetical protein WJX74_011075 [Apatococcus lobatus]|uniref:Uncharacterized protein n=1 Tax=Apatococcus lobatus TaxID=904363 RepID=A0AAW1SGT2_9CHLO
MSPGKLRAVGTRAQVWHGMARHTSGNLTKADLKKNRSGRIVSVRASERASREQRLGQGKRRPSTSG